MLGGNDNIRTDRLVAFFVNSDVDKRHYAALIRRRLENMHRLVAGYCKGIIRLEKVGFDVAAVALKSARNIDGKFLRPRLGYIGKEFRNRLVELAVKAYTENAVNHSRRTHTGRDTGIIILTEIGYKHGLVFKSGIHDLRLICRRISARQNKSHSVALIAEIFGYNEAVSAVFARAAKHGYGLCRRVDADYRRMNFFGAGISCVLHHLNI